MLLVVCQLSRDVIGYIKTRNVIGAFRSVYCESQLNSRLLLVKLGSLSNYDDDYNDDFKTTIRLMTKTTALHVRHDFSTFL